LDQFKKVSALVSRVGWTPARKERTNERFSHSTTDGRMATRIIALTPSMKKIPSVKNSVKFCHMRRYRGNQFCCARRRQVNIQRLYCLCWHL